MINLGLVLLGASAAVVRPPNQTKVQQDTWHHWATSAATLSAAAKSSVMAILDSAAFRKEIAALPMAKNTSDALLAMIQAEISLADSIHNVPYHTFLATMNLTGNRNEKGTLGGVPFNIVDSFKYLPTIWEEVAAGVASWNPGYNNYNKVQVGLMKYPDFSKLPPTFPEAYDRPLYSSLNIWKKSAGNLEFGNVALVLDRTGAGDKKIFISPIDTGCFFNKCGVYTNGDDSGNVTVADTHAQLSLKSGLTCGALFEDCKAWDRQFSTMQYFLHSIIPHLTWWRCSLGALFNRWYANGPVCMDSKGEVGSYFEGLISGAFLIPEDLLYAILKYDDFFGKTEGKNMQNWTRTLKRPLAWANDDHTGTVLDALVGGITGTYTITQRDKDEFNALWAKTPRPNWDTFHKNITYSLHLSFRGYNATIYKYCDPAKCVGCHFLGVNHYHACMFFK